MTPDTTTPSRPQRPGRLVVALTAVGCVMLAAGVALHLLDDRLPACTSPRVERAALAFAQDFGVSAPRLAGFRQIREATGSRDCIATVTNAAGATADMVIQVFRDAEGRSRVGAMPPRF